MVFYQCKLTHVENLLLSDIKDLQYGEIYDVELDEDDRRTINRSLTGQQKAMLDLIRSGVQSFQTIKVHQAEPAYAEVIGMTSSGRYRCKRLYKF